MCGLFGIISKKPISEEEVRIHLHALKTRGPNSTGFKNIKSSQYYLSLGHTRLSIQDTSNAGAQPYTYKHLTLVFNGEIYNFKELRKELIIAGYVFNSGSDTEVLIYLYDLYGDQCLKKLRGMFAFSIYNSDTNTIIICRDRIGVKPLYYFKSDKKIIFSSTLHHLQHFNQNPSLDYDGLSQYISMGHTCGETTIFNGYKKVPPGSIIKLKLNEEKINFDIQYYWSLSDHAKLNLYIDDNRLYNALFESIQLRTVSDAKYGVFLSGGIDSSFVASVLNNEFGYNIQTFTVNFENGNSEGLRATELAKAIGAKHHNIEFRPLHLEATVDEYISSYDEPFDDSSGLAVHLISAYAKNYVDVAISADGGDELFSGYNYYKTYNFLSLTFLKYPDLSKLILSKFDRIGSKHRFINYFTKNNMDGKSLYDYFYSNLNYLAESNLRSPISHSNKLNIDYGKLARYFDMKFYMCDDLLVKVDRASMHYGLEVREPLLDHILVELVFSQATSLKVNFSNQKFLLKNYLAKLHPNLFSKDQVKRGFSVPLEIWLQKYFSNEFKDALLEIRHRLPLINSIYLDKQLHLLKKGQGGIDSKFIWRIFVLNRWLNKFSNFSIA